MAHGTRMATSTLKPSTTSAWSMAVNGPWSRTSAHCHRAKPSAVPETATVPIVATRTRSGRRINDVTARMTTAPPSMTITGRMAR